MELMISISDNVATNLFIGKLGLDEINSRGEDYGLYNTHVAGKLFQNPRAESYSTAQDMNRVLVALQSKKFVEGELYEFALEIMGKGSDRARIGKYSPEDVFVAGKGGTISYVVGDSALIFYPEREPVAMTIFVVCENHDSVSRDEGSQAIAELSRGLIEYYAGR